MKTILGVAGAALLAVSIASCGSTAEAKPAPVNTDEAFLTAWHETFPNGDSDKAKQIAHDVCDAYKAGTTFTGEVTYLMALSPSLTGRQAGQIIGYATASYCPEFNDRH